MRFSPGTCCGMVEDPCLQIDLILTKGIINILHLTVLNFLPLVNQPTTRWWFTCIVQSGKTRKINLGGLSNLVVPQMAIEDHHHHHQVSSWSVNKPAWCPQTFPILYAHKNQVWPPQRCVSSGCVSDLRHDLRVPEAPGTAWCDLLENS